MPFYIPIIIIGIIIKIIQNKRNERPKMTTNEKKETKEYLAKKCSSHLIIMNAKVKLNLADFYRFPSKCSTNFHDFCTLHSVEFHLYSFTALRHSRIIRGYFIIVFVHSEIYIYINIYTYMCVCLSMYAYEKCKRDNQTDGIKTYCLPFILSIKYLSWKCLIQVLSQNK